MLLKILWIRGEIAPQEQFLLLSTIFSYLTLDFYVKTRIRFSLRDKQLFEITEVEGRLYMLIPKYKAYAICMFLFVFANSSVLQKIRGSRDS